MVNSSASSTYSRESAKSFEQLPRRLLPEDYNDFTPDWSVYASRMRAYDEAMVRGWKEEIDTLLVFVSEQTRHAHRHALIPGHKAGLFSAIVTAFNIEAYHLLQDDPTQASMQVLLQISQQLASLQATGANATTQPPSFQMTTNFQPSSQSVRINALWFSSLVFSLFSALVAIIVKQWTREYMVAVSLSPRDSVRLRQHRFDCMVAWHVPEIMALLPLLLQISLVLFFVGLIDFLFLLQTTVAAIVTALIAVALIFYAATTLTPAFDIRCSYKSPQSWLFVRIKRNLVAWFYKANSRFLDMSVWFSASPTLLPNYSHWSERDHAVMASEQDALDLKALVWIHSSFTDDDTLDTLVPFIPELIPDHAAMLVYTDLASNVHLPPKTFVDLVRSRSRSCSQLLRDVGASLPKRTRKRSVHMLLKLLEYIPRDHNPAHLGAIDVLWTLWELCMGACNADEQDPELYRTVLNGVAELLSEDEPFRLRRAALNLLWESAHQWTYLYCPSGTLRSNPYSIAVLIDSPSQP